MGNNTDILCRRSHDDFPQRKTSVRSWTGPLSRIQPILSSHSLYLSASWASIRCVSQRSNEGSRSSNPCHGQCLTYLSLSGLLNGVDPDLSFYLLSIANASSVIGRLGGGILADRLGETPHVLALQFRNELKYQVLSIS